MRIAVIGASGVAGRALLPALLARGHQVRAAFHSALGEAHLRSTPCAVQHCNVLDRAGVTTLTRGVDALVNLATAIPSAGGTWDANDRIRREGTANVLAACAGGGVRLIQQSVAMLHCVDDSRAQTEDDALDGYGVLASALDLEHLVADSELDWRIVRGAAFYGPGTGREEALRRSLADPAYRIPGDGSGWISLVHVADFAAAVVAALETTASRQAYIACDDHPWRWNELIAQLAGSLDVPVPPGGGASPLRSFRTSNAKLRGIGWAPRHPGFALPAAA